MSVSKIKAAKELRKLLGVDEQFISAGTVFVAPSTVTRAVAANVVKSLPLDPVLSDLGVVMARVLGDALLAKGLRPADYAELPELADGLAAALVTRLQESPPPEKFSASLVSQLRMKG